VFKIPTLLKIYSDGGGKMWASLRWSSGKTEKEGVKVRKDEEEGKWRCRYYLTCFKMGGGGGYAPRRLNMELDLRSSFGLHVHS